MRNVPVFEISRSDLALLFVQMDEQGYSTKHARWFIKAGKDNRIYKNLALIFEAAFDYLRLWAEELPITEFYMEEKSGGMVLYFRVNHPVASWMPVAYLEKEA